MHPIIDTSGGNFELMSREHMYRPTRGQWDQLGRDFVVAGVTDDDIIQLFRQGTGGKQNEDWYGWCRDVLAPFDGTVTRVQRPDSTNAPGKEIQTAALAESSLKAVT